MNKKEVFTVLISWVLLVVSSLSLSGCATAPGNVDPIKYSDAIYADMECQQLEPINGVIQQDLAKVTEEQRSDRADDLGWGIAGGLFFWPVMFMMNGNDATVTELAMLKGQSDALEDVMVNKECMIIAKIKPTRSGRFFFK